MECIGTRELRLIKEYRLLWNQHAEWTRMAINAIIFSLPNQTEEVNRLLRNPVDFGKALQVFYGRAKARQFCQLLTEHLTLAAQMIEAMMAGDCVEAARIRRRWYQNGREIASFLACINPFWSYESWKRMFFEHLDFVERLATTLLSEAYQENIEVYDQLELEAMEMADDMSGGIIRQFLGSSPCCRPQRPTCPKYYDCKPRC